VCAYASLRLRSAVCPKIVSIRFASKIEGSYISSETGRHQKQLRHAAAAAGIRLDEAVNPRAHCIFGSCRSAKYSQPFSSAKHAGKFSADAPPRHDRGTAGGDGCRGRATAGARAATGGDRTAGGASRRPGSASSMMSAHACAISLMNRRSSAASRSSRPPTASSRDPGCSCAGGGRCAQAWSRRRVVRRPCAASGGPASCSPYPLSLRCRYARSRTRSLSGDASTSSVRSSGLIPLTALCIEVVS
jgi:hypothetical protein